MARNTIILKGLDSSRYGEGRADVAIKPGYWLLRNPAGNLIPHNVAGGTFPGGYIAIEDALIGMTVTGTLPPFFQGQVGYIIGNLVRYFIIKPGDECLVVLKTGQVTAKNSKLSSNGDGTFKVATALDGIEFEALESLDLTIGGSVDTLTPARRL